MFFSDGRVFETLFFRCKKKLLFLFCKDQKTAKTHVKFYFFNFQRNTISTIAQKFKQVILQNDNEKKTIKK